MHNLPSEIETECLAIIDQLVLEAPKLGFEDWVEQRIAPLVKQGAFVPQIYLDVFDALRCYSQGKHSEFIQKVIPLYRQAKSEQRLALCHYCEYRLGSTMYRLGRNSEAINYLTKALACKSLGLSHLYAHINNYLGLIQFNLNKYDAAIALIEVGIKCDGLDDEFLVSTPLLANYANTLAKLGHFDKSEKQFTQIVALIEQHSLKGSMAEYYYICGYAGYLECLGKYQQASEWYEKAFQSNQQRSDIYQQLEDLLELCETAHKGKFYARVAHYLQVSVELLEQVETCSLFDGFADLFISLSELNIYTTEEKLKYATQAAHLYRRSRDLAFEQEIKLTSEVYDLQLREAQLSNAQSLENNLSLLSAIGSYLTTSESLDAVAMRLHDDLSNFMKMDVFGIALYDAENNTLNYEHFYEDGSLNEGFVVDCSSDDSLSSYVFKRKKPYIENNFSKQEQARVLGLDLDTLLIIGHGDDFTASAIFSPIMFEGEVLGVFTVQSKTRYAYSSYHVRILEQLINYLAMGLMNIKRHDALLIQKAKFKQLSVTDQLTGLFNRQGLTEFVNHATTFYTSEQQVGIALIDIDHFKQYNDHYGHLAGDKLLVKISECLNDHMNQTTGAAFRFGGDEFMLVVPDASLLLMEQLLMAMTKSIQDAKVSHVSSPISAYATLSIGAVLRPTSSLLQLDSVIHAADEALYKAKSNGRNQVVLN